MLRTLRRHGECKKFRRSANRHQAEQDAKWSFSLRRRRPRIQTRGHCECRWRREAKIRPASPESTCVRCARPHHRIGIVRLAHAAAAHPRVPPRDEIIAAEAPFTVFDTYLNIILSIRVVAADLIGGGDYVDVKLNLGI